MSRPKGLGRGLTALLERDSDESPAAPRTSGDSLATRRIEQLVPGRYQPRTHMDEAALNELAQSIRAQGMIQPILVRPTEIAERYEIIAGERRWRAARIAGLQDVPVVIREVADQATLAMALIENIQREDLNALEEARGLQRLLEEFNLSHEQIAEAIGRSRAAVSNLLRLLNLSQSVQDLLLTGQIDMGHARALLSLTPADQIAAAQQVLALGLSVRATETLVQQWQTKTKTGTKPLSADKPAAKRPDPDVARLEQELSESLGTRVEIKTAKHGRGRIVLAYDNLDHLDDLLARIRRPA